MRRLIRSIAATFATSMMVIVAGIVPAQAASQTLCGSGYQYDRVAARARTDKGDHKVFGETAGIDSQSSVTCDVNSPYDADYWIDMYKSAAVYKRVSGEYKVCVAHAGTWRGTFTKYTYGWALDLDGVSGKCGWASNPIKVRHIAKGEWSNGTVKSVTVYVTDSHY